MNKLFLVIWIAFGSMAFSAEQWPENFKHVVAYCYDHSADKRGSSISFPDGSLHQGIIKATTQRLTEPQTIALIKVLNKDVEYGRAEVECYDPHHAFVFYDENWKIVASIDICFLCENYVARPKGASKLIDLRAMEAFCREIGMPLYEDSEGYTNLYNQEQPSTKPEEQEQKKKIEPTNDPFDIGR